MPSNHYTAPPVSNTQHETITLPPNMVDVEQVANLLGVSKMTVYRLIDDGELPAYRFKRNIRLDPRDVMDFVRGAVVVPGTDLGGVA